MTRTTTTDAIVIKKRELREMLREVVREVMRDELRQTALRAESWQFDPESPLYQALIEIRKEAQVGQPRLLTDKEVWGK
ncbi:MAG: hypothetical protein AB1817_01105 [Chloroflexota bacterium]